MNMLLARIVMIAKQIISDFISKNPARNSVTMVASSLLWSRPEHVSTPSMSRAPHRIREFFLEKTSLGDSSSARHEKRMYRDTSIHRERAL
jgi:hypothetical protein